MKRIFSSLIFASIVLLPVTGWARQPFDWQDPSFVECDQDCLYNHGNEVISLQGRYILQKVEYLKDPSYPASEKRQNLGAFCIPGEKDRECIDRFIRIAVHQLTSVRKSIATNDDSVASLVSRGEPLHGSGPSRPVAPAVVSSAPVTATRGQVPYVPTYESLKQEAADSAKLHYLTSDQYVAWVDQTAEARPSVTDFPKFKTVKKDPTDKTSDDMIVLDTDAAGNILYDKDAFDLAMNNWRNRTQAMNKDLGEMRGNYKTQSERANQAIRQFAKSKLTDPVAPNSDRYLFNQARGPFVTEANALMKEKGLIPETKPVKLNQPAQARAGANQNAPSSAKASVSGRPGSSIFSTSPNVIAYHADSPSDANRTLASGTQPGFKVGSPGGSAYKPSVSFVQQLTSQSAPAQKAAQSPQGPSYYDGSEKVGVPIPRAPQAGVTAVDQISVQAPLEDFETKRIEGMEP